MMPAYPPGLSRTLTLSAIALAAWLSGCANLAPTYSRPEAPVPATWQADAAPANGAAAPTVPLSAQTDWRDVIQDERLRGTIDLALNHSRSLRLAVTVGSVAASWIW